VRGKCTRRTTTRPHRVAQIPAGFHEKSALFLPTVVVFAHSRVRLYGALNASGKSLIEFSPPRSFLALLLSSSLRFPAIKVGNAVSILSIRGSRNWGDNEDNSANESREISYFIITESLFAKNSTASRGNAFLRTFRIFPGKIPLFQKWP